MKQRYEPLGGSVFEDDSEKMMLNKIIRRNGESHVKRFIFWHDKQLNINDTYTPEDIRNASGIPNTENGIKIYEQMIRNKKNPVLKYLLEQERDNTKKRGMYKKRRNWCIE